MYVRDPNYVGKPPAHTRYVEGVSTPMAVNEDGRSWDTGRNAHRPVDVVTFAGTAVQPSAETTCKRPRRMGSVPGVAARSTRVVLRENIFLTVEPHKTNVLSWLGKRGTKGTFRGFLFCFSCGFSGWLEKCPTTILSLRVC